MVFIFGLIFISIMYTPEHKDNGLIARVHPGIHHTNVYFFEDINIFIMKESSRKEEMYDGSYDRYASENLDYLIIIIIQRIFTISSTGIRIVNFLCLVLCLNVYIPIRHPNEPPIRAVNINVFSLILHLFFRSFFYLKTLI